MKAIRRPQPDVYTRVTDKIIADLEQGVRPWAKPWKAETQTARITLPVRHNGIPYRGINILLLWGEQLEKGYQSNRWMTFKQALELGANVRKGEHGSPRCLRQQSHQDRRRTTKAKRPSARSPFMKGYTVFNVDQIENLPDGNTDRPEPEPSRARAPAADRICRSVFCQDRRHHPSRRQPGLLRARARHRAIARPGNIQYGRKLRSHQSARDHPLDSATRPASTGSSASVSATKPTPPKN